MVLVEFFFVVHFHNDAGCLAEDIDALDQAIEAVRGLHFIAGMRKGLVEFLIDFGLVFETAHQSPAHAGNLAGVE